MSVYTSKITVKGQVTVPAEIRNMLAISPGDEVEFKITDHSVQISSRQRFDSDYHEYITHTLIEWKLESDRRQFDAL